MWFSLIFVLFLSPRGNTFFGGINFSKFPISDLTGSKIITDYEWSIERTYTSYYADWTRSKDGYWFAGQFSYHSNIEEDRRFQWLYRRPKDSNTDYSVSQPTYTLPTTNYDAEWTHSCSQQDDGYHYALSTIVSKHDNHYHDRQFTFTCRRLPEQFTLEGCSWPDDYVNHWNDNVGYKCPSGLMKGIESVHNNPREDRRWKFECCHVIHTPMDILTSYENGRLVTEITSNYQNDGSRITTTTKYGRPKWYDGNIVSETYPLTETYADTYYWVRLCPRNGAFTAIAQNTYDTEEFSFLSEEDGAFSFECATLIDEVKVDECEWTDYLNAFHSDFTANCVRNGVHRPIRGIQAYYSPASDDHRFKVYCCSLNRGIYTKNNDIIIKAKTNDIEHSESAATLTFNLCWNNYLYQCIVVMDAKDTWFTIDDVVHYDSCGNERILTISTSSTEDGVSISEVAVKDGDEEYIINAFDVYESSHEDAFWLKDAIGDNKDVVIAFPDDYLTVCGDGNGCNGTLYNLDDYGQYLITITPCASFTMGSGTPRIGIVLRGTAGNLDKYILTGPTFEEVFVGHGNIGDLIHINIEYESGPDFCIESVTLYDPYRINREFGRAYFGDGSILSGDCSDDGDFRVLTGIQYVPCYDTPFSITTYETSLYASVQIHSCSGSTAGITSPNSELLSLTITGMSKNNKFVSTDALSLKSSNDWSSAESRDYTLPISGEFEKVTLITITNNGEGDDLCVDSVLINGQDAFLTHYWVGRNTIHGALPTIPAVLQWPICDIELTTTITAEAPLPVNPDSVATSTCVNRNRLLSVDCEISQTFETYEETLWEHQTGTEVTDDLTMEIGTEVHVSYSTSAGTETEIGSGTAAASKAIKSVTKEGGASWSFSASKTEGKTTVDLTTDGTVDGETIGIECSGSVSVPPSQQIPYSLFIDHSAVTLTTLTDMKMTKCSAYLYGDDYYNPNDYIYIYGIEGQLTVKDATNCYVSFSQADQVSPEAGSITCGEERALTAREWGTYVPKCNETDPTKYAKCQCAYGDKRTEPTCGCVDETTGNLLETLSASVVAETDTYKWTDWCHQHCGSNSYIAAKAAAPHFDHFEEEDDVVHVIDEVTQSYKKDMFSENNFTFLIIGFLALVIGFLALVLTYIINSSIACCKKCRWVSKVNKYQYQFDSETETEIVKDMV